MQARMGRPSILWIGHGLIGIGP